MFSYKYHRKIYVFEGLERYVADIELQNLLTLVLHVVY